MKKNINLSIEPGSQVIRVSQSETILQNLLNAGVIIDHSCGGNGTCGTCRIKIENNLCQMSPPNEVEADLRSELPFDENERLACQNYPYEGLVIRLREKKIY